MVTKIGKKKMNEIPTCRWKESFLYEQASIANDPRLVGKPMERAELNANLKKYYSERQCLKCKGDNASCSSYSPSQTLQAVGAA